jgi:hypothetical protein
MLKNYDSMPNINIYKSMIGIIVLGARNIGKAQGNRWVESRCIGIKSTRDRTPAKRTK